MAGVVKGILQQETCSVKWKINRFFADCQKKGDYYKSPLFWVHYGNKITKWYLTVYPKGSLEVSGNITSLFLCFDSKNKIKMSGVYEFTMMNVQNDLPTSLKISQKFTDLHKELGWREFIARDTFNMSTYNILIDDTVIILCKLTLDPPSQNDTESFDDEWPDNIGSGFCDYGKLLESGNFSDVTLNVQDKKIKSHKAVLSCHSPVFEAMFEHDMKEKTQNTVDITDIDYDVMMELLRFIYSGKVKDIEKIASDLLVAADKYQIIELKSLCEKTLHENLTVDNAADYLKLTEMCDTIHLEPLVVKFVAAHHKDVEKMPGFADLSNRVMHQIILAIGKLNLRHEQ